MSEKDGAFIIYSRFFLNSFQSLQNWDTIVGYTVVTANEQEIRDRMCLDMITAGSLSKGRNTGSIDVADQVQVPGCRRFHKYPSFSLFLLKKQKAGLFSARFFVLSGM
nr:MAG TPA: hypothetical protein [Caudoviricetes sp.]